MTREEVFDRVAKALTNEFGMDELVEVGGHLASYSESDLDYTMSKMAEFYSNKLEETKH